MKHGQKSLRMNVSDGFILCTKRTDTIFSNNVTVIQLPNNGSFESFERTEKQHTFRFKSGIAADVFFETVNAVMDYQDGLRSCIAPVDYKNYNEPDDNWVESSFLIGPYLHRQIKKRTKEYNRNTELHKIINAGGLAALSPKSEHIVLDTAQIDKNGVYYVYNLLVKPEDIKSGYNPNGFATVEIVSFVSEYDAENYSQSSQVFKIISKNDRAEYKKYMPINQRRMEMFAKIMSDIKEKTK